MKKIYFAPETEEIKIASLELLTSSPDSDTTDPVTIIDPDDSEDSDFEEWGN